MNPAAEDWKIAARRRAQSSPEYRTELTLSIAELLETRDAADRRAAHHLAQGILELDFANDAELLALLREPAVV